MNQRPPSLAISALVVAAGYYLGAQVGLSLTFAPATTSVLWPPNAILTAALLMTPPRAWWVCLAAAFPAHVLLQIGVGFPSTLSGLLFLTNCSEALLATVAVRALSDAPDRFDSLRRVTAFIGGAGLLAPIVSSFADAAVVNLLRDESYWNVWRVRVFANVLTQLSVVPAIIVGYRAARRLVTQRPSARRVAEAIGFVVTLTAIAALVFGRPTLSEDAVPGTLPTPIVLLFPVFGWAAMRFGVGGISAALLGAAFVASYETATGDRPFATMRPIDSLIAVQMILVVVAMPLMSIAGLLDERRLATAAMAARLRFEELFSSISASFLRFPDDAVALRKALGQISEFCGADCVALLQLSADADDLAGESVWKGPGVAPLSAEALRRHFPDAMTRVLNGETVAWQAAAVARVAAEDRRALDALGFRDLVILPFVAGHSVRGALALATTGHEPLSPPDLQQLRLIADVIANARTRRKAELDSQRSRQELAHLARRASINELASALAHQLNQPLAGILANAQASQRLLEGGAEGPAVADSLADIVHDCRRARDVIQRVREMVAPSQPQMAALDVEAVVRDVAMLLSSDALIRRVTLSLEFDGDASPVHGDRVLIQQAVLNVIVNAIDAVAERPLQHRVVSVRTGSHGRDHVQIRVHDQGSGLPAGSETRVFEPFFSTKATGLGMGLGIARTIVESHGGVIDLYNDPTGVVVTINLPVAETIA